MKHSQSSRHKVKSQSWIEGLLITEEFFFFSLEDAMDFITESEHESCRVYNEHEELVHEYHKHGKGKHGKGKHGDHDDDDDSYA